MSEQEKCFFRWSPDADAVEAGWTANCPDTALAKLKQWERDHGKPYSFVRRDRDWLHRWAFWSSSCASGSLRRVFEILDQNGLVTLEFASAINPALGSNVFTLACMVDDGNSTWIDCLLEKPALREGWNVRGTQDTELPLCTYLSHSMRHYRPSNRYDQIEATAMQILDQMTVIALTAEEISLVAQRVVKFSFRQLLSALLIRGAVTKYIFVEEIEYQRLMETQRISSNVATLQELLETVNTFSNYRASLLPTLIQFFSQDMLHVAENVMERMMDVAAKPPHPSNPVQPQQGASPYPQGCSASNSASNIPKELLFIVSHYLL